MNLTREIKKLKREVRGHYGQIAEDAGVSKQAVSQVLNGDYNNEKVIEAAINVRDQLRKQNEELFNKLKS